MSTWVDDRAVTITPHSKTGGQHIMQQLEHIDVGKEHQDR